MTIFSSFSANFPPHYHIILAINCVHASNWFTHLQQTRQIDGQNDNSVLTVAHGMQLDTINKRVLQQKHTCCYLVYKSKNLQHKGEMLFMIVATLALASLSTSQVDNFPLPFVLPARVINTTGQVCPPDQVRASEKNKVAQDVRDLLRTATGAPCQLLSTQSSPATSCSALPTGCPSDYYWVRSSNGSAVQVYCDMDRVCGCNDTGGWTCVAFLNMTDPNQQCPGAITVQI